MRIALFNSLSKEEQKKELVKVHIEIAEARKKLNKTGVWKFDKDTQKRIKNGEEVTIWEAKKKSGAY